MTIPVQGVGRFLRSSSTVADRIGKLFLILARFILLYFQDFACVLAMLARWIFLCLTWLENAEEKGICDIL